MSPNLSLFAMSDFEQVAPWVKPSEFDAVMHEMRTELSICSAVFMDSETSGLVPTSKPQVLTAKELKMDFDNSLRMRVLTVNINDKTWEFDLDLLSASQVQELCDLILDVDVFIAHNVGFDLYWARYYSSKQFMPKRVLDTMLLARILAPDCYLRLQVMAQDEGEDPELAQEAYAYIRKFSSGWSLANLALILLRKVVSKEKQGPKNWCAPILDEDAYRYATADTVLLKEIYFHLVDPDNLHGGNPISAYEALFPNKALELIEPQVKDVVKMREHGICFDQVEKERYCASKFELVSEMALKMAEIEPKLTEFVDELADPEKGIGERLNRVLGQAFIDAGIDVQKNKGNPKLNKEGTWKIGEKDLRKAQAELVDTAKDLYGCWVKLSKAKKAANMAIEFGGFAARSPDGMLHPLLGMGPISGRLSSAEPNSQQAPGEQGFRNLFRAKEGYKMVAVDFGALDVRTASALAGRMLYQMNDICETGAWHDLKAVDALRKSTSNLRYQEAISKSKKLKTQIELMEKRFEQEKEDNGGYMPDDARKAFFKERKKLKDELSYVELTRLYGFIRRKAEARGDQIWGSLRDAFAIPGMDIHTWTTVGMLGKDPNDIFGGLSNDEIRTKLKEVKEEIGDKRKTGKVGNLSLLYAMGSAGLQEAARKNYGIFWTLEESDKIRKDWLTSYPEIELWHLWTAMNPYASMNILEPEFAMRQSWRQIYLTETLGGRPLFAIGLNSALAYPDQGTGADILGLAMKTLSGRYPDVFECIVNQVHDEMVFMCPNEKTEQYTQIIQETMVGAAHSLFDPYGVKCEASPAVGDVWLKD